LVVNEQECKEGTVIHEELSEEQRVVAMVVDEEIHVHVGIHEDRSQEKEIKIKTKEANVGPYMTRDLHIKAKCCNQ
jgi:hypothetical protein